MTPRPSLRPGAATLGVLGGGQLGRMFVHAAQSAGYRVAVLEPDTASPAGAAADLHVRAAYDDPAALDRVAATCAAVTTEFENVPADALQRLADSIAVSPPAHAVRVCQHRLLEKRHFVAAGVPCAPHASIEFDADLESAHTASLLPGILKTARMGYDGKGQAVVADAAALRDAWVSLGRVPCVLERRLPLKTEISVIVARGADGGCVHLPVQQNRHRDGILATTRVPAVDVDDATAARAVDLASRLAAEFDYVGVLCVEFFVLDDGSLVANEMAPRPHNSGHHSIDACDVSQFDLQLRTLAGLPLVQPRLHSPAVMLNLLGDLWFAGAGAASADAAARAQAADPAARAGEPDPVEPDWPAVLALPGAHLHLYGKSQPRRGRKMGHLTVTAPTAEAAWATAARAAALLGLPPP